MTNKADSEGADSESALARCSFCTNTEEHVRALIAAPVEGVHICDTCVALCHGTFDDEFSRDDSGIARAPVTLPFGEARRLSTLLTEALRAGCLQVTSADVAVLNRFDFAIDAAPATGPSPPA